MNPLKIGISGVRGVVGSTFTPHLAVRFTSAFCTYLGGGEVYICEDARPSGKMIRSAVISALIASGCAPVDFGICPLPALQFALSRSDAAGGIAISAGHNPEDWNALKFIRPDGLYLNSQQSEELLDIYHQGEFLKAEWKSLHPLTERKTAEDEHISAILSAVDVGKIKAAGFSVALDLNNGACSTAAKKLLVALGCKIAALNDDPGQPFPHDPEPCAANMRQLQSLLKATGFDVGFMMDTAGERLGIVTGKAEALSEEKTFALCAGFTLERSRGPVVTNICTTLAIDEIAKKHKAQVIRTPVGQANVAEAAMKNQAAVAGEGSGGVIFPETHYAADALAAIARILDGLARNSVSISSAAASLPRFTMLKRNITVDYTTIFKVIHKVRLSSGKGAAGNISLDLSDGVKLIWRDSWLHIRPSNTEPLIRIIAEARKPARAEELISVGEELIRQ